ncbi:MAG: alpha/beta fold hydrolase [Candidatus Acidiferrales bacterium]
MESCKKAVFDRLGKGSVVSSMGLALFLFPVVLTLALSPAQAQAQKGRMVDVGGHRLHVQCLGQGTPTVVIDGGAGTWSIHYSRIQSALAATATVCTYDRAGLGASDAGPRPRTSSQIAEELHRLLHEAGITPPVVLVGHSLGGYNVRIYQAKYPEEVAALVLLEGAHEEQWERLPQEVRQLVAASPPYIRARAEQARQNQLKLQDVQSDVSTVLPPEVRLEHQGAWLTSKPYDGLADEVEAVFESAGQVPKMHSLGDLPLVVLSARNSYAAFEGTGIPTADANRVWLELQNELASLSRRSTHLFTERDHNLHVSDPEAAVAAIQRAVDQVRAQPQAVGALGVPREVLPLRSTPELDRLLAQLESAYNAMDADAFVNLFAEDASQLDVNRRVHVKGRTAWLAWTRRINAAHSHMKRVHRGRAKVGDWVVAEIEWSGTVRGAAIGAAADRTYRYTGLALLRVENGKIRQQILYGDYASLTEQLNQRDAAAAAAPSATSIEASRQP